MFWRDDPEWETGNLLIIWHQSKHVRVVIETISECGLRYAQTQSLIWEQQVSKWSSQRDVIFLILCSQSLRVIFTSWTYYIMISVCVCMNSFDSPTVHMATYKKRSILIMVTSSVGGVCLLLDLTLALWPVQTSNQNHAMEVFGCPSCLFHRVLL